MKKIRIKKQAKLTEKKYIAEDTVALPLLPTNANGAINTVTRLDKSFRSATENAALRQYIIDSKKDHMAVEFVIPSKLMQPFLLAACPDNLRDLMQGIPTTALNRQEKFENIRGMMNDPAKTFDHASDIAKNEFEHIDRILVSRNGQAKESNESLDNYTDADILNMLNEADFGTAVNAVGTAMGVGKSAGVGLGVATDVVGAGLLSALASFAATAAPTIASFYILGAVGLRIGGEIKDDYEDDSQLKATHLETHNRASLESDLAWNNDNAPEAITEYLTQLMDSLNSVFDDIAGKSDEFPKLIEMINQMIGEQDKTIENWLKSNDELAKLYKKNQDEKKAENTKLKKEAAEKLVRANKLLITAYSGEPKKLAVLANIIANFAEHGNYKNNDKKSAVFDILTSIDDDTNSAAATKIFDQAYNLVKLDSANGASNTWNFAFNDVPESQNIEYNDNLKLFEDDNNEAQAKMPKTIDLTDFYNQCRSQITAKITPMFPLRAGENLPGIKEAKENMKKLIEGATTEIKTQIEQVCRTGNAGTNSDITGKAAGWLKKHPARAAKLTNLWTRHELDLNDRMTRRLKQMTDYGDKEHILGWAKNFCVTVLPDIIARMFTYRYMLRILHDNNMYFYDANSYEEDAHNFDENKDAIMASQNVLLKSALYNASVFMEDPTKGGVIIYDDANNNFVINENSKPSYIGGLALAIMGHGDVSVGKTNMNRKDLSGYQKAKALYGGAKTMDELISEIKGIYTACGGDAADLNDEAALTNLFQDGARYLTDDNKTAIKNAYDAINKSLKDCKISGIDQSRSIQVLLTRKNPMVLITAWPQHKLEVLAILNDYNKKSINANTAQARIKLALGIGHNTNIFANPSIPSNATSDNTTFSNVLTSTFAGLDMFTSLYLLRYQFLTFNGAPEIDNCLDMCSVLLSAMDIIMSGVLLIGNESSDMLLPMNAVISAYTDINHSPKAFLTAIDNMASNIGLNVSLANYSSNFEKDNTDKFVKNLEAIFAADASARDNENEPLEFLSIRKLINATPIEYDKVFTGCNTLLNVMEKTGRNQKKDNKLVLVDAVDASVNLVNAEKNLVLDTAWAVFNTIDTTADTKVKYDTINKVYNIVKGIDKIYKEVHDIKNKQFYLSLIKLYGVEYDDTSYNNIAPGSFLQLVTSNNGISKDVIVNNIKNGKGFTNGQNINSAKKFIDNYKEYLNKSNSSTNSGNIDDIEKKLSENHNLCAIIKKLYDFNSAILKQIP